MASNNLDFFVTDENVWSQVITKEANTSRRPALFLDRDGVVIEEVNYLHRPEDVNFIPGAIEVIRRANDLKIPVIIITNQAGIGRRYYSWQHFLNVQHKIFSVLEEASIYIDAVFACPHHPEARTPYFHQNHPWRKPNPGMLIKAESLMGIDIKSSWIAGDRSNDLRAGLNAGCSGGIHLQTGHGIREIEKNSSLSLMTEEFKVKSLGSIAEMLTELPLFKLHMH